MAAEYEIRDVTSLAHKLYQLIQTGHADRVTAQLPRERVYQLPSDIARRIGVQ